PNSFWKTNVTNDIRLMGSFQTMTTQGRSGLATFLLPGSSVSTGATGGWATAVMPSTLPQERAWAGPECPGHEPPASERPALRGLPAQQPVRPRPAPSGPPPAEPAVGQPLHRNPAHGVAESERGSRQHRREPDRAHSDTSAAGSVEQPDPAASAYVVTWSPLPAGSQRALDNRRMLGGAPDPDGSGPPTRPAPGRSAPGTRVPSRFGRGRRCMNGPH